MDIYQEISNQILRGLETSADATRLVLLGIQTGYSLKAMEQEKQAG